MISGLFVGNTPFIRVAIGSRHSIQVPFVVLDTGFTGDIQVTPEIAKELKLKVAGITSFRIADGKVIGWFQGRTEWGPRALGNRSILVDPRRAEMKDLLNSRIKHRESFRPFAPSVLAEKLTEYFEKDNPI